MLTLDLVDRLLASTLVPRDAKLAAVESWRREIAAIRDKTQGHRQLELRLAQATGLLAAPRRLGDGQRLAGLFARIAGRIAANRRGRQERGMAEQGAG